MKTPIQELLDYTTDLLHTFDSEERVAMAVLDYLKTNKKSMLEKEKEVMCKFADNYVEDECYASVTGSVGCDISTEEYFEKTFKTKER